MTKHKGGNNSSHKPKSEPQSEVSSPRQSPPEDHIANDTQQQSQKPNIIDNIDGLQKIVTVLQNQLRDVVEDKNNLVTAVRKLKIEAVRTKQKIAELQEKLHHVHIAEGSDDEESDVYPPEALLDFDEISRTRDFILVGANRDPFAARFDAKINDPESGKTFLSSESFYTYLMAKHFGDAEAMQKLTECKSFREVIDISESIKKFDETEWEKVKLDAWVSAQKLKFLQVGFIGKLLVSTGTTYIALASQDKTLGTGWRITRNEAARVAFWEGQNMGGKALMKIRHELKDKIEWKNDAERKNFERKAFALKRFVWRRQDPVAFQGRFRTQPVSMNHEKHSSAHAGSGGPKN